MHTAPLRTIDPQYSRESDSAFALRAQKELGSMFSDLRVARSAKPCPTHAQPTFNPALQPPGARRNSPRASRAA
eukprot:6434902-Pyramimonas_sp.AAC.1